MNTKPLFAAKYVAANSDNEKYKNYRLNVNHKKCYKIIYVIKNCTCEYLNCQNYKNYKIIKSLLEFRHMLRRTLQRKYIKNINYLQT